MDWRGECGFSVKADGRGRANWYVCTITCMKEERTATEVCIYVWLDHRCREVQA